MVAWSKVVVVAMVIGKFWTDSEGTANISDELDVG